MIEKSRGFERDGVGVAAFDLEAQAARAGDNVDALGLRCVLAKTPADSKAQR